MSVSIIEGQKADRIAEALEVMAVSLASDSTGLVKNWKSLQNLLRAGMIGKVLSPSDTLNVEKESGLSVTVTGGVTSATVNEDTFLSATGIAQNRAYEFVYDGAVWTLEGIAVELPHYGITYSGTPAEGDAIVIHEQAGTIVFDVLGIDYDVPVNPAMKHSLSILARDVLLYNSIPFCASQALYSVAADIWPDGIPAETTLNITLNHGAYNGSTSHDGTYQFTTPVAIPVGGKIRHTTMGVYQSSYTQEQITGGTFTIYDAAYNVIAQNVACSVGSDGTDIGTTTAADPQYKSGTHVNFTQRNAYGSNINAHSANRKWMNSSAAGAASGEIASWWTASDEFDMPVKSTLPGFLHGLDPSFVACIGRVYKRTALPIANGYGYIDTQEYVWAPSMTEMGYGANNGVYETTTDGNGAVKQTGAYPLYVGAGNADKIKVSQGTTTARYWWLRSPYPSLASHERCVIPSGALNYSNAYNSSGVVPGLSLI